MAKRLATLALFALAGLLASRALTIREAALAMRDPLNHEERNS